MSLTAAGPTDRVEQLIALTQRLSERLCDDLEALRARQLDQLAKTQEETARLANLYRHESARVKADPGLVASAPATLRQRLAEATRALETLLDEHLAAVKAETTVIEGLVRTVASEIARQRRPTEGYGPGARTQARDARAVALNQRA